MQDNRSFIRRLMISVNTIDGVYANISKSLGIKENTLALLDALDDGKAHSQIEICREWLIPKTTLNTIVRECVREGYIELISIHHSKEKQIRLTALGRSFAEGVLAPLHKIEDAAFAEVLHRHTAEFTDGTADFAECFRQKSLEFFKEVDTNRKMI